MHIPNRKIRVQNQSVRIILIMKMLASKHMVNDWVHIMKALGIF